MLFRFTIIIAVFIFSCKRSNKTKPVDYTGYVQKSVTLIGYDKNHVEGDTLGRAEFKIPQRLDTFYRWTQWSDCGLPCAFSNYRFADKRYNQIAESGFFFTYHPDSLYQFTIQHKPSGETLDGTNLSPLSQKDTSFVFDYLPRNLCVCEDFSFYKKEFKLINGRNFIITGLATNCSYLTWKKSIFLVATTKLKDRYLHFIGECCAKDTSNFTRNMYKTLLSIIIEVQ